jgi:hypothetical protein
MRGDHEAVPEGGKEEIDSVMATAPQAKRGALLILIVLILLLCQGLTDHEQEQEIGGNASLAIRHSDLIRHSSFTNKPPG